MCRQENHVRISGSDKKICKFIKQNQKNLMSGIGKSGRSIKMKGISILEKEKSGGALSVLMSVMSKMAKMIISKGRFWCLEK